MAVLALLLLVAPLPAEKLELLPRMWPAQRTALEQKVRPVVERGGDLADALADAGIDKRVLELIARVETGPLLKERYARRLVFLAPDLTAAQRRLFGRLVIGVDGAQLALAGIVAQTKDEIAKQALRRRIRTFEQRYWRMVQYALTVRQRVALRKLYPESHAGINDIVGHLYRLRGMTPTQASRIRALATEFESESVADVAEARRLEQQVKAGRKQAQAKLREVRLRQAERTQEAYRRGREVLTKAQFEELEALVPLLSPAQRAQHPGELVKKMHPRPEQAARLEELGARVERRAKEVEAGVRKRRRDLAGDNIGEESPQMVMMQMMQLGARAEITAEFEAAARVAVLEVLTPQQILGWIVGG